jgi:hypothetical protein
MEWVCAQADAAGKSVTVAVEKNIGAQTLYRRLGFREIADRGVHWDMEWAPQPITGRTSFEYCLLRHAPATAACLHSHT